MSSRSLPSRITPLTDSLKEIQHLNTRLSILGTTPGSTPTNPEEGDTRVELAEEIHQSLKELEEEFELVRQEVEDQTNTSSFTRRRDSERERERANLAALVTRLGGDLKSTRTQFRKAQLQAKKNADAAQRKERELLFAGIKEGSATTGYGRRKGQEKLSQEEILLNASSDVTAALRRTHNLMQNELERSRFAQETLEQSTKQLAHLGESYSNLDTLLSSSRSLVSSLIYSQKSDTWYLTTAFYVLAATICWLVYRRLIYGPSWWLIYFPVKLIWWLTLTFVHVFVGSFSALTGAAGAKNQSRSLSVASEKLSTSLAQIPTGTGQIPKSPLGMPQPSVRIGAGEKGAKGQEQGQQMVQQPEQRGEKSMSDQVGEMAEKSRQEGKVEGQAEQDVEGTVVEDARTVEGESSDGTETLEGKSSEERITLEGKGHGRTEQQGTVLRERRPDEIPNPKKRMWEEPIDRSQEGRPRDEL